MKVTVVSCPNCGASVVWSRDNPQRPFCSQRCKTADLGAWATESYRIPVSEQPEELQDEPPGQLPVPPHDNP
jgi:uncharacterized protein